MSALELTPNNRADLVDHPRTLYDEYSLLLIDLGGGPVLLSPEQQNIFSGHIRMDRAQRLAGLLGYLIQDRVKTPLAEPVVVIDLGGREELNEDQKWIAWQAIWRTTNFVGVEDVFMVDLEKHLATDEQANQVEVRELELPNGGFVSTYLGSTTCKVLLTPESVLTVYESKN